MLTAMEAKRHYIYIKAEHRGMFPPVGEKFEVIVENDKSEVSVDTEDRIWASLFWDHLSIFEKGQVVIMTKNRDGSFTVTMED